MRGIGLDLWDEDFERLLGTRTPSWFPDPEQDQLPGWGPEESVMALTGYQDCRTALSQRALESQIDSTNLKQSDSNLLFLDGPDHSSLRSVISKALPNWRVTAASTAGFIDNLVGGLPDHVRIDLVGEFAVPIAEHASCAIVGLDQLEEGSLAPLLAPMSAQFDPGSTDDALVAGVETGRELLAMFRSTIREKSFTPGSALDHLNEARIAGELSTRQMLATLVMLAHASFQNTANLLSFAAIESLTNTEAAAALRGEDTSAQRRCVEELLRLGSPARFVIRRAQAPTRVGDISVKSRGIVAPCLGMANRDPAAFIRPDELDLDRERITHLTFGAGPHTCLGAALARAETLAAVRTLTRRYRQLSVVSVTWGSNAVMYGPNSLVVELSA